MIKLIKTTELRVGMYVMLSGSWLAHPFWSREFQITSRQDIRKIIASGIPEVQIDLEKSTPQSLLDGHTAQELPVAKKELAANPIAAARPIVPAELQKVLQDRSLPPQEKAASILKSSLYIMDGLLQSPTAENISLAKNAIHSIADCIIKEDNTTDYLIRITSHDFYTYTHSVNVGILALALAKEVYRESSDHNLKELGAGFFLHDLGKVHIDQGIINKPGKLSPEEFAEMQTHPAKGVDILLMSHELSEECKVIVLQHHEREDGSGYPHRLQRKDLHDYAKICALADIYDALISERSYKKQMQPFSALKLIRDEMGNQVNQRFFEAFVRMLN